MKMILTLDNLPKIAKQLAESIHGGDIVTFSGSLASGKTTLITAIVQAMGYQGRTGSPTFILERRYPVNFQGIKEILHIDFYRLSNDQIKSFDWHDYIDDSTVALLIEWAENAADHLPRVVKSVELKPHNATSRELNLSDNFTH